MKRNKPNVLYPILLIFLILGAGNLKATPETSEPESISCNTAPVLICPSTYFGCPNDNLDPMVTGQPVALPGDANCPSPIVSYSDSTTIDNGCLKIIHRTWFATYDPDSANVKLHTQCQQTLFLIDTQAPEIQNCPSDINIDLANNCEGIATWPVPTATDDCGIQSFTASHTSGSSFPLGTTTVTYIAEDICGQSDTCSFNVIVTGSCCSTATLNCPSNSSFCVGSSTDPIITGFPTVVTNDPSCPVPFLTYSDSIINMGVCPGAMEIERTWVANDPIDSTAIGNCIQIINLLDTIAPIIQNAPMDITVSGTGNGCSVPVTWSEPTVTDNCGLDTINSDHSNGSSFPEGTTTVIYTASDACGNSSTISFNVTVECIITCTDNPTITCPNNFTSCPSDIPLPDVSGSATAQAGSSECESPIISFHDAIINTFNCNNSVILERVWTATDPSDSSLSSSCLQTITLNDDEAPTITNVPSDITVNGLGAGCSVPVNWTDPIATDNCGLESLNSNFPNGSVFNEGVNNIIFTATDSCGSTSTASFNIVVMCTSNCNTAPSIICPADFEFCPGDIPAPSISGLAIASPGSSDCDAPILSFTDSIISSGPCTNEKIVKRTWTATDPNDTSLFTSCDQIITLKDNTPPVITQIPSDITVYGFGNNCAVPVNWTAPQASDNCGIASWSSNIPNGSTLQEGVSTITYTAIDSCGLISTGSFNITVNCIGTNCTTNPLITCPSNYYTCPENGIPHPSVSGLATALPGDTYCDPPVVTYSDWTNASSTCPAGATLERIWTATDPNNSNLSSSCIQFITLEDNSPPILLYCPTNIVVTGSGANCASVVTWNSPVATDNCSPPNITVTDQYGNTVYNGGTYQQGVTTVTYTAIDICENTSTCSFDVSVICNDPCADAPEVTCPPNKVLCPSSNTNPSNTGYPFVIDNTNCPDPYISYQDIIISSGPCIGQKEIQRHFTIDNPSGLNASCVQNISLKDNTPPVIFNCPQDMTIDNSIFFSVWNTPSATDNCSVPVVTSSHPDNYDFPYGTTTVTYTATDHCGNTSTCSFDVTVINTNVTLNCPDDITVNCQGSNGAFVDWTPPVYEGTCSNCDNGLAIPGFIYMGSFNGNQYYCSTSTATWPVAKSICESNGGYLASINSAEENAYLANILTLQSAWIGLSDSAIEGEFEWTSGEPLDYTNWYPNQPNDYNYNQDYVEMLNNGQWNDQYNHYALEYIMELPCSNIHQISGPQPGSFLYGGVYEVKYQLVDACGGQATCSFNITVEGGLTVNCPADIETSALANSAGVEVKWDEPEAYSCCSNCNSSSPAQIPGFVYMGSFGNSAYYCSVQNATWPLAKQTCELNGGHLAVINSQEENEYLANILTLQSAWIGLSDVNDEGNFEWVNGDAVSYTNWYPGQPNNFNQIQNYVEMLNSGQWNDQYNHYALEYIMEIPGCLNITQTSGPISGSILPPGSNHTVSYQVTDACGNIETCSFNIDVESIATNTSYCPSVGQDASQYFIDSVVLNQLNNKSGNDNGYGDYTNMCANLEQGQSYALHLTPGFGGTAYDKVYWKVWIDYNLDGDFNDNFEFVAYGCGLNTLSGMITVPQILWPGETRMRIIASPSGYAEGPCENVPFGETEDYCITMWGTGTVKDDIVDSRKSNAASIILSENVLDEPIIHAYPNPVVDQLNIDLDTPNLVQNISIVDINGRIIKRVDESEINTRIKINTREIPNGVYLLSVIHTNGSINTKSIIIQH